MLMNKTILRMITPLLASTALFFSSTLPATQTVANTNNSEIVQIKEELSSPLMLAQKSSSNYLKISLNGLVPQTTLKRTPLNIALVIDRSSSMNGERIQRAKEASILLVNQLTSEDTLSIVVYDSNMSVLWPAAKVNDRSKLIKIINEQFGPRGMTALYAGVEGGLKQVEKAFKKNQINRIILLSDGQANVGPTSIQELSKLARLAAQKGISITTVGLGNGYDEDIMTTLANYSDGNHAFIAKAADLEMFFEKEFKDVMSVIAQDVVVTISLHGGTKPIRLLGREGDISKDTVTVKLNQLYLDQEKYVLLELAPKAGNAGEKVNIATVKVSYNDLQNNRNKEYSAPVTLTYEASEEKVKATIEESILVDAEIQKTNLVNEEALQLMKQGKNKEAQEMLKQSNRALTSFSVTAPAAQKKLDSFGEKQQSLLDQMATADENSSRKMLSEKNFNVKNQKK